MNDDDREGNSEVDAKADAEPTDIHRLRDRRHIRIFTIGSKPYGCEGDTLKLLHMIDKWHAAVCPYVTAMFNCYDIENLDWADPKHTGENAWQLHYTMKSPRFWEIVDEVNCGVNEWLAIDTTGRPMNICFYSKEGRHRSVATARLCFAMLRGDGLQVSEPVHLTNWAWPPYMCTTCEECRNTNTWKCQMMRSMVSARNRDIYLDEGED